MSNIPQFGDFFKAFGEFKAPQIDFNSLFTAQRRNMETLTAASQIVAEGVQAVSRRQAEVIRGNMEGFLKASKEALTNTSAPETTVARQADYARNALENTLNHLREVSETVTKSGFEAFDVINKRAAESLEEISAVASSARAAGGKKK